jgi:3-oxoacyl-[acyl-carrier protein] reductase
LNIAEARAVVTGAASGLGLEFCLSLCREGAQVAAVDINQKGLDELSRQAEGAPGRLRTYRANVARENEVVDVVSRVVTDFGSVNVLINNAGIYRDGLLVRSDEEQTFTLKMPLFQWQSVLDVDLTGPFLMTREVTCHMMEKKIKPAVIINISSVSRHGNVGQGNYSAAKAGLVAATMSWAHELSAYGIRVTALAPGVTQTPMVASMLPQVVEGLVARVPLRRLGEPSEIYAGVRFILGCEYFNGRCLEIDGGLKM